MYESESGGTNGKPTNLIPTKCPGASWGGLWGFLGCLGAPWGRGWASWEYFGDVLNTSGDVLGKLWRQPGAILARLEGVLAFLGCNLGFKLGGIFWKTVRDLESTNFFERFPNLQKSTWWALLGVSCAGPGAVWRRLGLSRVLLGMRRGVLGKSWEGQAHLNSVLGRGWEGLGGPQVGLGGPQDSF